MRQTVLGELSELLFSMLLTQWLLWDWKKNMIKVLNMFWESILKRVKFSKNEKNENKKVFKWMKPIIILKLGIANLMNVTNQQIKILDHEASFFEFTIRYVGGLLGAFELTRDKRLLDKGLENFFFFFCFSFLKCFLKKW